jgi:hypothetical protein
MAVTNVFASGGSSVTADYKLKALQLLIIQAGQAETKRNRDNKNNQTAFVAFNIAADSQSLFTATLTIPSRMEENAAGNDFDFVVEETFDANYFPFTAGTGDLSAASSGMDAIVKLAKNITFTERQIEENIVIQKADQVLVTPDIENGQHIVTVNLPIKIALDAAAGTVTFDPFDYLEVLSLQD